MSDKEIRDILCKQLELLAEDSKLLSSLSDDKLAKNSHAMVEIAKVLTLFDLARDSKCV